MNKWTEKEKLMADRILNKYFNREISFKEGTDMAEKHGISGLHYIQYASDRSIKRYNEDFKKYIGKVKEEALEDKFTLSQEEIKLLRENPNDISLEKGIRDDLQRRQDIYEINLAKYYYKVTMSMMESGFDDTFIRKYIPLTDEAIDEIRQDIANTK